jgi:sugar lactone lactonase YvrE
MMKPRLIYPFRAELGEGMHLFPDGDMRWVDLPNGRAYRWDSKGNHLWHTQREELSKVLPWCNGTILLSQTAIIFLNQENIEVERIKLHDEASNLRCSDSMVLPNGELLVGILDRDLTPNRSKLIQVKLDRSIVEIVPVASISNGIALLANGEQIVWADSPRKELEIFDFDQSTGSVSGRRTFAKLPDNIGLIDGICADASGGVWAALWAGSGVAYFDARGVLVEVVNFEAPNVTSCAFDNQDNLLITTGTATLTNEELERFPGAGGLWMIPQQEHGARRAPTFIAQF